MTEEQKEETPAAPAATATPAAPTGPSARAKGGLTLRVSQKGALSVYGLGRFPVTLYKEQWTRLLDAAEEIRGFVKENDGTLKSKAAAGGE